MGNSPSEKEKTRQLGWRVAVSIKAEIEALADADDRSPGKQLERIYKEWKAIQALRREGGGENPPKEGGAGRGGVILPGHGPQAPGGTGQGTGDRKKKQGGSTS